DTDRAKLDRLAILWPHERGIVRRIADVGELYDHAEFHRPCRYTRLEFFGEKIVRLGFRLRLAQVLLPVNGKKLVSSRLLHPVLVHEDKGIIGEERLIPEAGRDYLDFLHEFQR